VGVQKRLFTTGVTPSASHQRTQRRKRENISLLASLCLCVSVV